MVLLHHSSTNPSSRSSGALLISSAAWLRADFPKALAMSLPYPTHLLINFTYIFALLLSAFCLLDHALRVLALVCLLYN